MTAWKQYHTKRKDELSTFLRAAKAVLKEVGPPVPEPLPEGKWRRYFLGDEKRIGVVGGPGGA